MNKDYKSKVDEILEQALTEKTFSLEIVEKIKALRDDFKTVSDKNEELTKSLNDKIVTITSLTNTNNSLNLELTAYKYRERAISDAEKKADKINYELVFQTQRANEIKELFGIVFKNPVVRENAYKTISTPVSSNGYVNTYTGTDNESKTIEQE